MEFNAAFKWERQPKAEQLLLELLEGFTRRNGAIGKLAKELMEQTSTRLFDWVDHLAVIGEKGLEKQLEELGFVSVETSSSYRTFHHPGAQLPRLKVYDSILSSQPPLQGVAVAVDYIADFLMARGEMATIEGSPFSSFRRCSFAVEDDICLWVIERRGGWGMEPQYNPECYLRRYLHAKEKWQCRPRHLPADAAIKQAISLADEIVAMLGEGTAASLVLEVERDYWQARNRAGQVQKGRQDRLGMGWANHDHHTFRSSRHHFKELVRLFEVLGFRCRERFYAGEEAGWGAQVMENIHCRMVLFLDVDLDPGELAIDFAHQPLGDLEDFGTIGLWCALHGDSILSAGMHHLEAQFLFEELTQDLNSQGVGMMMPFSSFEYLKQAFTEGEVWPVAEERVEALLKAGKITADQGERFLREGALGSHLENLQRREGYKGFNQKNVSFIIKETDPRVIHG